LDDPVLARMDVADSLFLTHIQKTDENVLFLQFEAGIVGDVRPVVLTDNFVTEAAPVAPGDASDVFHITFDFPIAYAVIYESFESIGPGEGGRVSVMRSSGFLDMIFRDTFAGCHYPGAFFQILISSQRHIVCVAATAPPLAEIVPRASAIPGFGLRWRDGSVS